MDKGLQSVYQVRRRRHGARAAGQCSEQSDCGQSIGGDLVAQQPWPNIVWGGCAVMGGVAEYLLNGATGGRGIIAAERIKSADGRVEVVGQTGKDIRACDIQAQDDILIRDEVPDGESGPKKPIAPDEGAGASPRIEMNQLQAGGNIQVGTIFNQYPLQKPGRVPHFINHETELANLPRQSSESS